MTTSDIGSALLQAGDALDKGDVHMAMNLYEDILRGTPDHHEACLMLGSLYGETGRLAEATELLQRAIASRPEDASAGLVLARIHHATGQLSQAIDLLEQVRQTAEDVELTYTLATLVEQTGDRERARYLYEHAIEQDPDATGAWLAMGSFRMSAGEFEAAEGAYREALRCEPGNPIATRFLSVALTQQDRAEEAEGLLRAALEQNADDPELHYYLAHALQQQGMSTEALASCDQALALAPDERRFIIKKAEIFEGTGDLEQSLDLLKPILTSGDIPVEAALIFARLSHPLGMVDDGKRLLQSLSSQTLLPLHRQQVSETLEWLELV
jgi:tetratricopeptide (TPR) repeat protein